METVMAETAYKTAYLDEWVHGFEDMASVLRATTITETYPMASGAQSAVFLVADSGSATAKTRGANGLIPARADNQTQNTCNLAEYHDLTRKTGFNVFASQANQRQMMQKTGMAVINRQMDDLIIAELDTFTNDTGTAAKATLDMVIHAQTILGNNFVDVTDEDNLFCVVSPAFRGYMMQTTEFASGDYVEVKPFNGPARKFWRWMGLNWIVHPRLTGSVGAGGAGTSEQCFMYHRNSIGHAANVGHAKAKIGYDDEQDYSFARHSVYMGAKKLQNAGCVMMKHDASAYAAS